jgi:hypothetical protein
VTYFSLFTPRVSLSRTRPHHHDSDEALYGSSGHACADIPRPKTAESVNGPPELAQRYGAVQHAETEADFAGHGLPENDRTEHLTRRVTVILMF